MRIFLAIVITLIYTSALATDLNFSWTPNSEPEVLGYRIYYGPVEGAPEFSKEFPGITTATGTVDDIPEGVLYFTLTAYSALDESAQTSPPIVYNGGLITPTDFERQITINIIIN